MDSSTDATDVQAPATIIEEETNDVLYADPIRFNPNPPCPPEPKEEEVIANNEQNAQPDNKRSLKSSEVKDDKAVSFKLYRREFTDEYFLVMTEVGAESDTGTCYSLTPTVKNGVKKMKADEIDLEEIVFAHHPGEIVPEAELANSSNLTIGQRLCGWRMETRQRTSGTNKIEKFYTHERISKGFRSMVHVSTFIAYNTIY